MSCKQIIPIAIVLIGALVLLLALWNQHLISERRQRESHFIAIHFLAGEQEGEYDPAARNDITELLSPYGGLDSWLTKPFPDELVYVPHGASFTLEEPNPRRISLFRSDRLIATDRKWPRWKSSGEYARKFPDQKVPPKGFD
jgi:hypothetical protein